MVLKRVLDQILENLNILILLTFSNESLNCSKILRNIYITFYLEYNALVAFSIWSMKRKSLKPCRNEVFQKKSTFILL